MADHTARMVFSFGGPRICSPELVSLLLQITHVRCLKLLETAARTLPRGRVLSRADVLFLERWDPAKRRRLNEFCEVAADTPREGDARRFGKDATQQQINNYEGVFDLYSGLVGRPTVPEMVVRDDDPAPPKGGGAEEEQGDGREGQEGKLGDGEDAGDEEEQGAGSDGDGGENEEEEERARSANTVTLQMTLPQYREFSFARKASFCGRSRQAGAFRAWLGPAARSCSEGVIEALAFFAWETIGVLVQVGLRFQHEQLGPSSTLLENVVAISAACGLAEAKVNRTFAHQGTSGWAPDTRHELLPAHILEAHRLLKGNGLCSITGHSRWPGRKVAILD